MTDPDEKAAEDAEASWDASFAKSQVGLSKLAAEALSDYREGRTTPLETSKVRPGFGCLKGLIQVPDDFDAPLEDFKDYM